MFHQIVASLFRKRISAHPARASHKSKSFLHTLRLPIEMLESRRMLSVTAATLAGPVTTTGTEWDSEVLGGGVPLETTTQTVVGTVNNPFASGTAIETDQTATQSSIIGGSTSQEYQNLNSSGLITYGSTAVVTTLDGLSNTVTSNTSTTYSPAEVVIPPTLSPGVPVTDTTTKTVTTTGAESSTDVVQISETFTLEPAQKPVKVPAGNYKAYVVDLSITSTSTDTITGLAPITTGPTTVTGKEYFAAGTGLVEYAVGEGETELTKFTGTGGSGGGGGGGGGGTTETPAPTPLVVQADNLPVPIVGGTSAHGFAVVNLINTTSSVLKEKVTIEVFAVPGGGSVNDPGAVMIGTKTYTVSFGAGGGATAVVPITLPASLLVGTYTLLASDSVTELGGSYIATTYSSTGPTVTVAAPFSEVDFQGPVTTTLPASNVSGTPTKAKATVTLINNGNVAYDDSDPIELLFLGNGAGSSGTEIRTDSVPLNIKPGKTKTEKISLENLPNISGTFTLAASAPIPNGDATTLSTDTYNLAPASMALLPTLSPITPGPGGTGKVTLTLENTGNIPTAGATMISLYGSTQVETISDTIVVKPGESKTINLTLTADQLTDIDAAGTLAVQVVTSLGNVGVGQTPAGP